MLKLFFLLLMTCLFSKASFARDKQTCVEFFKASKTQIFLKTLARSTDHLDWENYLPSQNSLLLTDLKNHPTCLVILVNGSTSLHELTTPLQMENGIYEYFPYSTANPELVEVLAKLNIGKALLLSLHDVLAELSLSFPGGEVSMSYNLAIHEGFHLFSQMASDRWPNWVNDEAYNDRDELVKTCYLAFHNLLRQELRALTVAFSNRKNIVQFKAAVSTFISLREQRYLAHPKCEAFEASWEMTEGVAEYVGWLETLDFFATAQDYVTVLEKEATLGADGQEFFYSLGALQLFAINQLRPNIFLKKNPLLGEGNTSQDSIFQMLKKVYGKTHGND